ncbi:hypothetical protein ACYCFL_05180 [Stutzerimonas nitrititolerans]
MDESSKFLQGGLVRADRAGRILTNQNFCFAAMRQKVEHDTQRAEVTQAARRAETMLEKSGEKWRSSQPAVASDRGGF